MSHFAMIVVADQYPTEEVLKPILQPWHEYECTGTEDQYVIDVDKTDEARTAFETKDKDHGESFETWAADYYGAKITPEGRVIYRTNPNKKWDWWVVGGRYSGRLHTKTQAPGDVARVDNLDRRAMKQVKVAERQEWVNKVKVRAGMDTETLAVAVAIVRELHKKWSELPEPRPRGQKYGAWLASTSDLAARLYAAEDFDSLADEVRDGQTIEEWITTPPFLSAWGFVMDGQWIEKGEMGWWGTSSGNKPDWDALMVEQFDKIRPEQWIAIVDCHI